MQNWFLASNVLMWALVIIILLAALLVLVKLWNSPFDFSGLISEQDSPQGRGKASLSRFQFLIFTFVVAGLFALLCIESGTFVEVPNSVLGLIGISGGSYVVSKGIQKSSDKKAG